MRGDMLGGRGRLLAGEGSCGPTGTGSPPESSASSPAPKEVINCVPDLGGVRDPEREDPEEEPEERTPSKGLERSNRDWR